RQTHDARLGENSKVTIVNREEPPRPVLGHVITQEALISAEADAHEGVTFEHIPCHSSEVHPLFIGGNMIRLGADQEDREKNQNWNQEPGQDPEKLGVCSRSVP